MNISIFGLVSEGGCDCIDRPGELAAAVEKILLNPRYASFVSWALAISDDYQKGLILDLAAFSEACGQTAQEIAGKPIQNPKQWIKDPSMPPVVRTALNAIIEGAFHRR